MTMTGRSFASSEATSLALGLAGVVSFTPDDSAVREAIVVLNGRSLTLGLLSTDFVS